MTQTRPQDESPQVDEADALLHQMQRRHKRNQRIIALIVLGLLIAGGWALYTYKLKHTFYNASIKLAQLKEASAPPPDNLTRIHTTLLPDWFIAQSRVSKPEHQKQADAKHQAILKALEQDTTGKAIFTELHRLVASDDLIQNSKAIHETVNQWNAHMDKLKQPWWIDSNIMSTRQSTFFYTKSYKIVSDVPVNVSKKAHRTRIVARVDSTNIVENLLGHTKPGQDGAIILADRIYDFTLRSVWPLLHEDTDTLTEKEKNFAPHVLKEAQTLLPTDAWETIHATARLRRKLTRVVRAVEKRRKCGSRFQLGDMGYEGLPLSSYDVIRRYARRDKFAECPSITIKEADTLITVSDELRDTSNLKPAVEALVAFVSRGIAVHEARHDADHHQLGGFDKPLPCEPCQGQLSKRSRSELSAYLASFAVKGTAYTALFQACGIDHNRRTPHANAMRVILPKLNMTSCTGALPKNLTKQAQELEMTFFGRSQMVNLPDNYPKRIELRERRR